MWVYDKIICYKSQGGAIVKTNEILSTVIFTATVFAAFITSVVNIIISVMNNWRLKKLEKTRQINEIHKYRYSRLYELILNWHDYDSASRGETAEEIAFYKLLNLFMDDTRRYEIIKPLLDEYYKKELDVKKIEGEKLLNDLIGAESLDGTHSKEFPIIKQRYFEIAKEFDEMLKRVINCQLEELLRKASF